jgi:hypothetical protein
MYDGEILMRLFESSFPYIYRYFSLHLKSKMPVLECIIISQVERFFFLFLTKNSIKGM